MLQESEPVPPIDLERLERYAAGDCAPAEQAEIEAALARQPRAASIVSAVREGLAPRAAHTATWDPEQTFAEFQRRRKDAHITPRRTRTQWSHTSWLISAVLVLAVTGMITRMARRPQWTSTRQVYATHIGQRASISLNDHIRATLAPLTTLRVQGATVDVRGEAYFEVLRADATPLIVRTGAVTTRVLGTAFNVRKYPEDGATQIAVVTGKVSVQSGPHSPTLTLNAGMVGEITDSTATTRPTEDAAQYTMWRTGRLVFHDAPVREILATLTRWYGYQFRLTDSVLAATNLTAGMSSDSATAALATLKLLLNVDLTFEGDVVTLHPRRVLHAVPSSLGAQRNQQHLAPLPSLEVGR